MQNMSDSILTVLQLLHHHGWCKTCTVSMATNSKLAPEQEQRYFRTFLRARGCAVPHVLSYHDANAACTVLPCRVQQAGGRIYTSVRPATPMDLAHRALRDGAHCARMPFVMNSATGSICFESYPVVLKLLRNYEIEVAFVYRRHWPSFTAPPSLHLNQVSLLPFDAQLNNNYAYCYLRVLRHQLPADLEVDLLALRLQCGDEALAMRLESPECYDTTAHTRCGRPHTIMHYEDHAGTTSYRTVLSTQDREMHSFLEYVAHDTLTMVCLDVLVQTRKRSAQQPGPYVSEQSSWYTGRSRAPVVSKTAVTRFLASNSLNAAVSS